MGKALLLASIAAGDASGTTTVYYSVSGYGSSEATEANADTLFRTAGTLSKFYIRITTNGSGSVEPWTIRKNATNGSQTISPGAGAVGVFEDTSNTDSVTAGDKFCVILDTPAVSITTNIVSFVFDATTDTVQIQQNKGSASETTASTTFFGPINGRRRSGVTTESQTKARIRKAGTYKNMAVYVSSNARTTTTTWTSRKNGANGNLTLNYTSGQTGWKEDTANTDSVTAGNDYNFTFATLTGTQTLTIKSVKFEFVSTGNDAPLVSYDNPLAQTEPTTLFYPIAGQDANTATEANVKVKPRFDCTLSELWCLVTANAITADSTANIRKNGANANSTITITASATGIFNDTSNSDSITSSDDLNIQFATTSVAGTPSTTTSMWGINVNSATSTNFNRPLTAETVSIGESLGRVFVGVRALTAQTTAISESLLSAIIHAYTRPLTAETVSLSESILRLFNAIRAPTAETITIAEDVQRVVTTPGGTTLFVKQGTLTKSTSTGVPVTQNITGLGFTPMAIWMWTEASTGTTFDDHWLMSYGFSDGTNNGCVAGAAKRITVAGPSISGGTIRDDACVCILDAATTPTNVLARGKVTGFSSGQVSFQWDANTAVASVIHYMVIGGSIITNVKVLSTTTGTTSTGNKAYTGAGFQPDFAQIINGSVAQTTINATNADWIYALGTAKSSTARWITGGNVQNATGSASDDYNYKDIAKFAASWASGTGTVDFLADFVSFDSDGLTINYSDGPDSSTQRLIFLCIKGGLWDLGNFTKRTSTGTQDVTITATRDPEGLQLFSNNGTITSSGATANSGSELSIGGGDGTTEGAIFFGELDTSINTCARIQKNTKAIILATEANPSSSSTIDGEADISDMATAGKFQLNWTTSNSTALLLFYWCLSYIPSAGNNFDRPLTAETISVSESIARLYGSNRALTLETITIGESQARAFVGVRALSAETITIGESLARLKAAFRTMTAETNSIGESLARQFIGVRTLTAETIAVSESLARLKDAFRTLSDTTVITESLVRVFGVVRTLSDTVLIGESLSRVLSAIRTLSDTIVIGESLTRLKAAFRSLSDTTAISDSLARIFGVVRSLSDTTAITESLARMKAAFRILTTETIPVSEALAKAQTLVRSLSDTTVIGETISRLLAAIRALATQVSDVGDGVTRTHTPISGVTFTRNLAAETIAISESIARVTTNIRTLIETTIIAETLTRLQVLTRALTTEITAISESLVSVKTLVRTLSQTTAISESLTKVQTIIRSLTDTTVINESLSRLAALTRTLSAETTVITGTVASAIIHAYTRALTTEIIPISESLTKFSTRARNLIETVIIAESLTRLQVLTRVLTTEITNISGTVSAVTGAFEVVFIETVLISESLASTFLHIVKGLPLYLQPQRGKRPEGVGPRNRSMERDSPSYLRKQLDRIVKRIYGFGRTRSG